MALKIGDRVRENTSTTGVSGLSLTGSPAGFQKFSDVLSSGDITYYTLEENDKWEVGIGTYGSNNLLRTTILSSSNSGSKISLGGSGVVFITYPADKALYKNEDSQAVIGASGIIFSDNTILKASKLVELNDVSLSGTPSQSTVVDLNITNKSLSIGDMTGPTNSNNVLIGYGAGSGITTGNNSVIIGAESSTINKTGQHNVHIGAKAGPIISDASTVVYSSVAVGYSAGNKMRHESTAIGYKAALHSYEIGFVSIGYQAGSGVGSYSTSVGYEAATSLSEDYSVAIGYRAGYNGGGESSIWIGQTAGQSSTGSTKSIGIGKNAGKSSSGDECIYIGEGAGTSNSTNSLVFIGNSTPATNGTLIKGDMDAKRVAIGAADVTLDDTLFIGVDSANDEGIVVKGAVSQASNLTSWKNSSDDILASVDKNGIIAGHGISATGNGIQIASLTPASTSNKLYNVAGTLYFNGSQLASAGASAEASYASGQAIANESDIVAVSGIAAYASGVGGGGGGDVTTAQLNYVSGVATYSSGVLTGGTPTFDDMYVKEYIYHNGDTNTYIKLKTDEILFAAGGRTLLTLEEASNDKVIINEGGNDVNFRVESNNEENLLFTDGANDKVGIGTSSPSYLLDVAGMAQTTGAIVGNSGIVLANNTPSVTTNTLYNDGGTLKFNGSTVGGGDVTTAQLNYVSGIAVYSSGQAISNQSNITALNTASGIATSLLAVSGTATSLISSSGIADYASGQAIANEGDIVAVSGIAAYASGVSLTVKEADGNPNVSNVRTIVVSNGTLTDDGTGQVTITTGGGGGGDVTTAQLNYVSGVAVYSSGQAISNQSNITALNTASGIATSLLSVSGTATSLVASSGIATYASGNTANITFGSNVEGDILYHNGTSFTRLAKGSDDYILKMNGNVPNWEAESGGGGDVTTAQLNYVSGIAVYSSGQAITNQSNITALNTASGIATSLLAVSGTATSLVASSGIATYASGQAIENEGIATYASGQAISNQGNITALNTASGIATSLMAVSGTATSLVASSGIATYASGQAIANESDIVATSGIANYASGQAISNQGNITALNTASGIATSLLSVSGTATSLVATSGIASYASGNTVNISFGSNVEGDILYHNGTSFTRLAKGTDDYILKMNGNVPNWEAESAGSSLTAGSGINVDGADKINIYGGTGNLQEIQLTSDNIFVPKIVFTGSGVEDTPITLKVLSSHASATGSGTALSFEGTQGQLFTITDNLSTGNIFSVNDITGLPLIAADASGDVRIGQYGRYVGVGTGVPLYGLDVSSSGQFQKGFVLSSYVPAVTTNTLYNDGGTLKFNGSAVGGGGASAEAQYASGQATSLNTASGIATSLLAVSGTATSLIATSGIATYASGQVNVSAAGTVTASKALILDSAKSFTGAKHGVFNQFDSRVTASGVTIGASGITLTGGAYVQEAVPANDTPTTEDATITIDLSTGNYHNVVLGNNVTKFEFINAKRGQRFLLRITQHAASAKTVAWTNVDYTTGGAAATVRWAGGGTAPTMSTSTSHTDVYGFLCTNDAGSAFDGFVVGQNLPD